MSSDRRLAIGGRQSTTQGSRRSTSPTGSIAARCTICAMPNRSSSRTAAAVSAAALLALAFGAPMAADTYPRQPGIDARHYLFRLTLLTSDSNDIQGEETVTLRVAAANTREAVLDLTSARPDGRGMTVTNVTSNDKPVKF